MSTSTTTTTKRVQFAQTNISYSPVPSTPSPGSASLGSLPSTPDDDYDSFLRTPSPSSLLDASQDGDEAYYHAYRDTSRSGASYQHTSNNSNGQLLFSHHAQQYPPHHQQQNPYHHQHHQQQSLQHGYASTPYPIHGNALLFDLEPFPTDDPHDDDHTDSIYAHDYPDRLYEYDPASAFSPKTPLNHYTPQDAALGLSLIPSTPSSTGDLDLGLDMNVNVVGGPAADESEMQIHCALAFSLDEPPALSHDLSLPPPTSTVTPTPTTLPSLSPFDHNPVTAAAALMYEPATSPPLPSLSIVYGHPDWLVDVRPAYSNPAAPPRAVCSGT